MNTTIVFQSKEENVEDIEKVNIDDDEATMHQETDTTASEVNLFNI